MFGLRFRCTDQKRETKTGKKAVQGIESERHFKLLSMRALQSQRCEGKIKTLIVSREVSLALVISGPTAGTQGRLPQDSRALCFQAGRSKEEREAKILNLCFSPQIETSFFRFVSLTLFVCRKSLLGYIALFPLARMWRN